MATKREIDSLMAAIPKQVAKAHESTGPKPAQLLTDIAGEYAGNAVNPSNYGFDEFGSPGIKEAAQRIANKAGAVYNKPGAGTDHSTKGDFGPAKKNTYPENKSSGPPAKGGTEGAGRTQE